MPAPLLHSRIRDLIELPQSPRQVIGKIKAFSNEGFQLKLDETDHDNIHFEMTQNNEEIVIHGVIRRWQGTESRLDFMGEVNVIESDAGPNRALIASIIILEIIVLFKYIILDSLLIAPAQNFFTVLTLVIMMLIPTIVLSAFTYWIILFIHNKNKQGKDKRWRIQQELAKLIEQFRELETYAN